MRKVLGALGAALALAGCDSLFTFDVPVEGQTTVPGQPLGNVVDLNAVPLEIPGFTGFRFTETQAFRDNDVSPGDIDSVRLASLRFDVEAPPEGNFDFLSKVEVFLSAPGKERRLIAEKQSVPAGVRRLDLDVRRGELKPYATSPEMDLEITVSGRQPRYDTTIRARAIFEVTAKIL